MAERLRRLTRNQIPSGSAGSNPADCEFFFVNARVCLIISISLSLRHDRVGRYQKMSGNLSLSKSKKTFDPDVI